MYLTSPPPMHETLTSEATEFFGHANFLVAKLTEYCNLRCKYCHQDALTGKPQLMPFETFKNAVRLILKPSRAPIVYVQFHGGEPLLCPDDFFREATAFARAELETPTRNIQFYIQTNLTRLTEEREKLLNDLKIGISYSLDGPPGLNDELRGGGRRILQNWRRMRTNGTIAGTICLIQPSNWNRMDRVLQFFDEEGIHDVRFNMMVPDGRGLAVDDMTVDKLFQAKKTILDFMLRTEGRSVVDVVLLQEMTRFLTQSGAPSSFEYHGCESFYCQAARSLFSVEPDGTIFACDRIAENHDWGMGNVNQPFLKPEREVAIGKRRAFQSKDEWWSRCEGCDAKKICGFSCTAYYIDKVDTREVECQLTKLLWAHFLERRDEIRAFVERRTRPIFVDEKAPLCDQPEETRAIKDLAVNALYHHVSIVDTLASNRHYQLLQRGIQYYVVVFRTEKVFEVDELVAEIARYNGMLPPDVVEGALAERFPQGKLRQTLSAIQEHLPEIFYPTARDTEDRLVAHARHEADHARCEC